MARKNYKWRTRQRRAQSSLCAYCALSLRGVKRTVEHVVPRSWGGPVGAQFNMLIVCGPCQRRKSQWESLVQRDHPEATGREKCTALLRLVKRQASQPRAQNYGPRRRIFTNIVFHVERAMHHSGWDRASPARRERFFGTLEASHQ